MKSALLLAYVAAYYVLVLQGFGDHALLLWPLIVLLFFWNEQKSILAAFAVGFLLDIYSPVFGVFSFLFPITILCGSMLTKTVFSRRSFVSFHAVSALLLLVFSVSEYAVFLGIANLPMYSLFTIPPLRTFIALRVLTIILQQIFLSLAYMVYTRSGKKMWYRIDSVPGI
jgi:hypothetical protein